MQTCAYCHELIEGAVYNEVYCSFRCLLEHEPIRERNFQEALEAAKEQSRRRFYGGG